LTSELGDKPTVPDVARWLRTATAGDRQAMHSLYQYYRTTVNAVVLAHAPRNEASDLVQDVFLAAFTKLNSLRDFDAFGAWLITIARNKAKDLNRRRRRRTDLSDEAPIEDVPDPRADPSAEARVLAILHHVRSLPEAYRETLLMRLVEGLTGPEIATRTSMTPESVRVNLCRGMKLLRDLIQEESQ
jgi:RNA polymerase sigma-70 factor, ECF subfamily